MLILSPAGEILSEITQGVPTGGPNEPCWHPGGERILVKHNGPVLFVSVNGERWFEGLDQNTGAYCQSSSGLCARTVQNSGNALELGKSRAKLSTVKGARDVRGWISWTHAGDRLAITEYELLQDRGCVSVVDKEHHITIVTPLVWSPYWVSWSPDDRFIIFSCMQREEPVRIIDIASS